MPVGTVKDQSYMIEGEVYFRNKTTNNLFPMGNTSALAVTFTEEEIKVKNHKRGGGNSNAYSRLSDLTGSISLRDFSATNLAIALRGAGVDNAGGVIAAELHDTGAVLDEYIPFNFVVDRNEAITVDGGSGALVLDTDYSLVGNGIRILNPASFDSGTQVTLSYTSVASVTIEALTAASSEYEIILDGANVMQDGDISFITIHRAKTGLAANLGFISEEPGTLELTFEILSDDAITGAGLSKFMTIQQQE